MTYDTIIIGGGILGCSTAFHLSRRGQKVLLLERDKIATGTTGNSFAWANASVKTTDRTYHNLNAAGVKGYNALQDEFGNETLGINPTGALEVVSKSDTDGYKAMQAQARALTAFGYANRWISNAELRQLEPEMTFPDDAEALLSPDDLLINAPHFTRFMVDQMTARGGILLENCTATELLATDEGDVTGLITTQGSFHADNIILATGQDTATTLSTLTGYDGFATRFPLNKVPGLILTTPPLPTTPPLRHMYYSAPKNELHILPEFNGGLKIASDDIDGMIIEDQTPDHLRMTGQLLLDRAYTVLPQLTGTIDIDDCKLGIGVRPYPTDGKTIIGPMPDARGLHIIATHSGITLAPVLGQLMAEAITNGTYPETLAPFALTRYSGFA
jgi:glycine/D-amino acid oxidase-like deaminating enzyme